MKSDGNTLKESKTWPLVWLAKRPRLVLTLGCAAALIFFIISYTTGQWTWFPRGGALMALCGFIVSVQESLLYMSARPAEYRISSPTNMGFGDGRRGPFGIPVFPPSFGAMMSPDMDKSQEEIDEEYNIRKAAFEDAADEDDVEIVNEARMGRPMRNLSDLTDDEFSNLRLAAILGVVGTFVWAFGDLIGGLPLTCV